MLNVVVDGYWMMDNIEVDDRCWMVLVMDDRY